MTKLAALIAMAALGLNTYVFYFMGSEDDIPPRHSFEELPSIFERWHCLEAEEMTEGIQRRLGVTDYLLCDFTRAPGEPAVNLYVGYHQRQVREGAKSFAESGIHPPRHCIPGSGWQIIETRVVPMDTPQQAGVDVNRLTIAKGNQRQLVYYWYQERGRVIASDYWKIIHLFWDRATQSRSDGALVRFTTPIDRGEAEEADARIRDLARVILPRLPAHVPD